MNQNIHIIAEAGTNHNGDLKTAETLVDIAQKSGADSIKFQIIYPEGLYLPKFYENGVFVENEVFHKRVSGMLPDDDYISLAEYCKTKGIGFSASIFDRRGLDLLDGLDVPYFKIASCDLNNSRFLMEVAERGRPMVVSTGMATLGEIERAVLDITRTNNIQLVLMHCVSVYPSTLANMNLSFIDTLQKAFGLSVGLSDHTETSLAAVIAVSKGVKWIEKHFTIDRSSPGFDHIYAMESEDMENYISDIRNSEESCQVHSEKLLDPEQLVKRRARRSIYAARHLQVGEVLHASDVLVVRPEGPLAPNDLSLVLNKAVKKALAPYEALTLENFE